MTHEDATPDSSLPARLAGRRALVTGASRGIGAALAERLAAEGADVAILARTRDRHPTLNGSLTETARRVESHGRRAVVIECDLSDPEARIGVVASASDALGGPVDILINNAAAGIIQAAADVPLRRVRLSLEVNVIAALDLVQQVIPSMRERGEGWIVNVSSGAADPSAGPPFNLGGVVAISGLYGAAKATLNRITNALAAELWGTGLRVNTIEPNATIRTEGTAHYIDNTPGGLGQDLPDGDYEAMEPIVEATLALCDCPAHMSGLRTVSIDLVRDLGLQVRAVDGSLLSS